VGDGTCTFFWTDRWLGEVILCDRFRRLFDLTKDRMVTVADMFALGWGEGGEAWQGRCLLAWEEEPVREFSNFLSNVQLHVDKEDMWSW